MNDGTKTIKSFTQLNAWQESHKLAGYDLQGNR
jgi:hypothetical protein